MKDVVVKMIIVLSKKMIIIPIVIILSVLFVLSTSIIISTYNEEDILSKKIIVIDAGHGGVDGGACNSIVKEKDINLSVALRLQKKLEDGGAKVIMTRTKDIELSGSNKIDRSRYLKDLNTRVAIVNNSSANIFLSIHTNASRRNSSVRGPIVFYANSHPHNRDMAYIFQDVFNTYEFMYNGKAYKSTHIPQQGNYYLLVNAKIPGLIIETGFITNNTDLFLLQKPEYLDYLADAIYQGIINYFLIADDLPNKPNETINLKEEHVIDMAEEDKE